MKTISKMITGLLVFLFMTTTLAGIPVWTFTPLTPTSLTVPANVVAMVEYRVMNQSNRLHMLRMKPIHGVTQSTPSGPGFCGNPMILPGKGSCILSLLIHGPLLTTPISGGPILCEQGSSLECYRPSTANSLIITPTEALTDAFIIVTGSPLILATGSTGSLTITNESTDVTATNVDSNLTNPALFGNVTQTGSTCTSVLPGNSCTLTFTAGNTLVPQTNFPIQGNNTNTVTAAIAIAVSLTSITPDLGSPEGGTPVTLTGTGLTGATSVFFGANPAINVNVVSSTTVTAVTPAGTGTVNVTINTPSGSITLPNAYTYANPTLGESLNGGVVACINNGITHDNLVAAEQDISTGIVWGTVGELTGASSLSNGAANTALIVSILGTSTQYAARLCADYEVDSEGNTPCLSGNVCYDDWFLPSLEELGCLNGNQGLLPGFTAAGYWTSTEENPGDPADFARSQIFSTGLPGTAFKSFLNRVRCVSVFIP